MAETWPSRHRACALLVRIIRQASRAASSLRASLSNTTGAHVATAPLGIKSCISWLMATHTKLEVDAHC